MPGVTSSWNTFYSSSSMPQEDMLRRTPKSGPRSQYSNGYGSDHLSDDFSSEDGPTYLLEHLATFSVGDQFGLLAPKDGLRRLLQMEKSSGIWTQKMQMRLEKNWVVIIDYENGDIVERFPMTMISDPTSYTSDDPRELYNNILIFIVKEDPKSKVTSPSEMHIFQCAQISAQDVVDDIKMFMCGKVRSNRYKGLPPPPNKPPPEPPANGISVREQVNAFNQVAAASSSHYSPRVNQSRDSLNDETSSTASDKYERDVAVLNHCFDDIEKFILRLQSIAAAYKDLEKRQKGRKKQKDQKDQKDLVGDRFLTYRAKPPLERDFFDIFQKFKLSFILLAKLKSHIHDPNAPELVHFLFTPLALIVDAAKDNNYPPNLASRVIAPILTQDSIELLTNCCTSKETDLWHSLGEAWTIPREQVKNCEPPYKPIFYNGWSPELQDERSQRRAPVEEDRGEKDSDYYYEERRTRDSPTEPPHFHPEPPRHIERPGAASPDRDFQRDGRSDFSADSIEHAPLQPPQEPNRRFEMQQRQWLAEIQPRGAKIVQVVYPRTANNDKELTVVRGEYLEVLDDSRNWWKSRNMHGHIAHVPHTIVTPFTDEHGDDVFNNPLYATRGGYMAGESPTGKYSDGGSPTDQRRALPVPPTAPADWVRRERQGKKGEFRYF